MNRHRLDLVSLIAGLVFLVAGITYLFGVNVVSGLGTLLRAWPLLLIAAGVAVAVGIRRPADDA